MQHTPRGIRKIEGTVDPYKLAVDLPALADETDAAIALAEAVAFGAATVAGEAQDAVNAMTPASIGAETPAGAQAKADTARTAAINEADARVRAGHVVGRNLPSGTNLNTLYDDATPGSSGFWLINSQAVAETITGLPVRTIGVLWVGAASDFQEFYAYVPGGTPRRFWRGRTTTAAPDWSPWQEAESTTGAQAKIDEAIQPTILLDTDGTPYFVLGRNGIAIDTDGIPYVTIGA